MNRVRKGDHATHGCNGRHALILGLSAAVIGCAAQQPWSFNLADFLAVKELPYDTPPQVIYRIDDHRFVTLEHYRDCNHGETFYNDTKLGIRNRLGRGTVENYQGRVINSDPTGKNLVFPTATVPDTACSDRGCNLIAIYSTDGGLSFHGMKYGEHIFGPFEYSKNYTVAATRDKLYVARKSQYDVLVEAYPFSSSVKLDKPYPPGFHNEIGWASEKKLMPDGLQTPSGQDSLLCDPSIKPTNPNAPLVTERK